MNRPTFRNLLRRRAEAAWPAIQAVDHGQYNKTKYQQQQRGLVGARVVRSLHAIVDIYGYSPRNAWNIAADHENDSELSHGVGEGKHHTGDESGNGERDDDAKESRPRRSAKRRGSGDQPAVDGGE